MGLFILGCVLCLIGAVMLETMLFGIEADLIHIVIGIPMGLLFIVPGILFIKTGFDSIKRGDATGRFFSKLKRNFKNDSALSPKKVLEEPDSLGSSKWGELLKNFREHFSEFYSTASTKENESIQWDTTQIYRSVLGFRKNRLKKLGVSFDLLSRRMPDTGTNDAEIRNFSDGKYNITEIEEGIATKVEYKREGKSLFSKIHNSIAYYTIVRSRQIGETGVICPNCGAEMTREALLDGCDFCGTKFLVEDLGNKVAEFAFRPDYDLEFARYSRIKNRIMGFIALAAVIGVVLYFTGYAVINVPVWMADEGAGVMSAVAAALFAIIISSVVFILAILILSWWIIVPLVISVLGMGVVSRKILKKLKSAPKYDKKFTGIIRKHDPHFSVATFYSGLQNKIASIAYAENEKQIQAFAYGDLKSMLGKYENVVDVDVEYMGIVGYNVDEKFQRAQVEANLKFTEIQDDKCITRNEQWGINLLKSAKCVTQIPCAPSLMRCRSCGQSIDFMNGKRCRFCDNEIALQEYDWVVENIKVG